MRFGNLSGRLTLFTDGGAIDVAPASDDRFGSDSQARTALSGPISTVALPPQGTSPDRSNSSQ